MPDHIEVSVEWLKEEAFAQRLKLAGIFRPALFSSDKPTANLVVEFLANIRNLNTLKAYARAAADFAAWCEARGLDRLSDVEPLHVAVYVEELQDTLSATSVKLRLAAIRMLFDWLVVGQIMPTNPASAIRGPKHSVKEVKTPVISADETRALLSSIDTVSVVGLRDRALIALLLFNFARVGDAVNMRAEDVYTQSSRTWVRLQGKGGKRHQMPCHHNLEAWLNEYIQRVGLDQQPKAWLFRTTQGQSGQLTPRPMTQVDVYRMIQRRAAAAGISKKIGCHTLRATGITECLRNGGKLEIAHYASANTTGLYGVLANDEG